MLPYLAAMVLIVIGIYALLVKGNLIKKIIGLAVFGNGIHLFLISLGYRTDGIAPIINDLNFHQFAALAVDPLPQAMILTSIVINLSIMAVALSIIIQAYRKFNSLEAKNMRRLKG